ncbi:efflux RND transporter permease subunit [Hydrotalea sandarakina]|jgi:cobalt-zinc-cadmium resistance protein CzcA|uniref:Cobalt-zinc-cadmium resistance protein CzcA n=1 Tax=Hydrotalea sandarakina TaxID=1004304 RepID=A0A2W7S3X9_9BACT|nr:CusA/CzcA family heavy metal efflux RND transporter [Hydrotalea sandarakina]PZX65806.1 cobalt-zinc-cadmium resistance protein CzcA [Hydrotalea sandarakina]
MIKVLKSVIGFSLKNKFFIILASVAMIIVGIITFKNMPIEAFPDVTNTEISIITQWPGRSAEEVEKFVTIPIELAMNPVQDKVSLRSTTIFGLSYVKLIFEDNVKDPQARQQVMNLLGNANLPNGVTPSVQPPTGPTGEIYRYTLKSNVRDVRELKTMQDWVIDRQLRSVPGVGDIVSFGGKTKTYEIQVNPEKLTNLGITPLDVFTAVQKTNINIGGDVIIQNNQAFVVRGIGLLNDINEIKNIIVQNINGVPVLVKDVANVEISNLPRLGWVARSNGLVNKDGQRVVTDEPDVVEAIILMRKGENPTKVLNAIKSKIDKLNSYILPADTQIVPYYDRTDLINYATHTVLHNLVEGILLVTLLVSLFMFNWRTTLIVSIIIPMALLFAFICLRLMGMSANLLSLGAVDFGIIIDGAVVMVEGMFVVLDHKARDLGMERFNKIAKLGLIRKNGAQLGKAIFFAKVIIITGLLPIFAFQKVEGKMFSPLAYTLGFALLGALITTLTLVPVLISILLKKNVHEKHNPFVATLTGFMLKGFSGAYKRRKIVVPIALIIMAAGLYSFKYLGSEFLPELDEGSIWLRVQTPYSISLNKSVEIAAQVRKILMGFPQVKYAVSQTGRPDDGTDVAGFYNNEFSVMLYPEDSWKPRISKEELIEKMNKALENIPGVDLNFSQPIMDNVEEAVSGVKGSISVKVYGDSLNYMEGKIQEVYNILKDVRGITDLGVIHNIGQPELDVNLNQDKMAMYGVATADANAVVAMAIGGVAASTLYEGIKTFDIRIRLPEDFRKTPEDIGNLLVPTQSGSKVPIKEIATITQKTGPCLIFRDDNQRYSALKFSIRGRDMGSTIAEAQRKVDAVVHLKRGYTMAWQGDFENQKRAENRLAQVVPISLALIFLLLFTMFGNLKDAALVFLNVPFAIVGGIAALFITGTNFSISAGIGFIALFGICIQDGVLLITVFKHNLETIKGASNTLYTSIKLGVNSRIRPVMMTALMAAIGLLPAAISHGIGSESSRPLARVVIGGILCAMIFSLWVFPLIFGWAYRNVDKKHRSANHDESQKNENQ